MALFAFWLWCLCQISVLHRWGRFWPKFESSVTGTEDVPSSVQSDLNVQSLEVDLSRLFQDNFGSFFSDAAMLVLRGCGAAWLRLLFSPSLP